MDDDDDDDDDIEFVAPGRRVGPKDGALARELDDRYGDVFGILNMTEEETLAALHAPAAGGKAAKRGRKAAAEPVPEPLAAVTASKAALMASLHAASADAKLAREGNAKDFVLPADALAPARSAAPAAAPGSSATGKGAVAPSPGRGSGAGGKGGSDAAAGKPAAMPAGDKVVLLINFAPATRIRPLKVPATLTATPVHVAAGVSAALAARGQELPAGGRALRFKFDGVVVGATQTLAAALAATGTLAEDLDDEDGVPVLSLDAV